MIISYDICNSTKFKSTTLESIIDNSSSEEWSVLLHKLGTETTFIAPKEQSLDELIEQVVKMNPESEDIRAYATRLKSDVLKINSLVKSQIMNTKEHISNWDKNMVLKWANKFRQSEEKHNKSLIREAISVIITVCKILYGYPPRFTQIMSVLIMINTSDNGLLMQVATGEGKSLIVSMLATLK